MARTESRTKTSIWSDEDFRKLTARAQRMYWLLYSQSTISLCGVVAITLKKWAANSSDSDIGTVTAEIQELEDSGYVVVDWDREELLVRTFVRHDGVARSPKTLQSARGQLGTISSSALRTLAETELERAAADVQEHRNGVSGALYERVSVGVSGALSDGVVNGVSDGVADRTRARARADSVSVSSLRHQSPSPVSAANGGDGSLRSDDWDGTNPRPVELAQRLAQACIASHPQVALIEANNVIHWAIRYVDLNLIEDAIVWAETRPAGHEIKLPRAVSATVRSKATDHGIAMPDFDPRKFA